MLFEDLAVVAGEPVVGADPQVAAGVLQQGVDLVPGQALPAAVGVHGFAVVAGEPVVGADPQVAAGVLQQGVDLVPGQALPAAVALDVHAVVARQAAVRADPQGPVAGLDQGVPIAVGQPVGHAERLPEPLAYPAARLPRVRRGPRDAARAAGGELELDLLFGAGAQAQGRAVPARRSRPEAVGPGWRGQGEGPLLVGLAGDPQGRVVGRLQVQAHAGHAALQPAPDDAAAYAGGLGRPGEHHVAAAGDGVELAHALAPGDPGEGRVGVVVVDREVEAEAQVAGRALAQEAADIDAPLVTVAARVALPGAPDHLVGGGLRARRLLVAVDEVLHRRRSLAAVPYVEVELAAVLGVPGAPRTGIDEDRLVPDVERQVERGDVPPVGQPEGGVQVVRPARRGAVFDLGDGVAPGRRRPVGEVPVDPDRIHRVGEGHLAAVRVGRRGLGGQSDGRGQQGVPEGSAFRHRRLSDRAATRSRA